MRSCDRILQCLAAWLLLATAGADTLEKIAHCAPARTSALEEAHATRGLVHALVIIDLQEQTVQLWRAQLCRPVGSSPSG